MILPQKKESNQYTSVVTISVEIRGTSRTKLYKELDLDYLRRLRRTYHSYYLKVISHMILVVRVMTLFPFNVC